MEYEEAEAWLLDIPKFKKKNVPEDTKRFLRRLGEPSKEKRIIHIAGTNGKGSVCAYLSSVLKRGGYRVGMFTSPHLITMRERFRINGEIITKEAFVNCLETVRNRLEGFAGSASAYHPSFFEMLFFMAMVYFEQEKVQVIVLETGLGGRLDATNSVSRKDLCIITRLGLDHMEYLGSTIAEIAGEKAGILQKSVPVVAADSGEEACRVLARTAEKLSCPAFFVSKQDIRNFEFHKNFIDFSFETRYYGYIRCLITTCAPYQAENAALALRALDVLSECLPVDKSALTEGMKEARWEGRMEEIAQGVYIDGAHNVDGIRAFLEAAERDGCTGRRFLLFSAVQEKQYGEMIHRLADSGLFHRIYVTEIENKRGISRDILEAAFRVAGAGTVDGFADTGSAWGTLLQTKQPEDILYIAGSLYLAGEIKGLLKKE